MRIAIAWLIAASAGLTISAAAHEGPLDSYGCHQNIAHGSYHCHAGELAGRQYPSKARMRRAYEEQQRARRPKPKLPAVRYGTGRE